MLIMIVLQVIGLYQRLQDLREDKDLDQTNYVAFAIPRCKSSFLFIGKILFKTTR